MIYCSLFKILRPLAIELDLSSEERLRGQRFYQLHHQTPKQFISILGSIAIYFSIGATLVNLTSICFCIRNLDKTTFYF